jgi:4-hydroxybenzoate polyprenyltransferase
MGAAAAAARVRLVHPFPSILNGAATAAIALLAGGDPPQALRIGLAMTAIQGSIGALNDLVDAPSDRGRSPAKPVADGLVSRRAAWLVAVIAAAIGFGLSAASGWPALGVAIAGAACGYAYDLRLSRTIWAWVPLAVALPLVPVYAWVSVTGSLPAGLAVIVPIGLIAGGGLAVGNALADFDVDAASGSTSVAIRLGRRAAFRVHALALGVATVLALASLPPGASTTTGGLVVAGAATLAVGIAALGGSTTARVAWRGRLGWQLEAVGVALLGVGWILALAG